MLEQSRRDTAPTLEEVAAAAGVSRSTASRVINGSSQVSPAVVAAVNAAIEQLDYTPNRAARSLANRQTGAIALVIPEDTTRFFGDPYFAAIVQGISQTLDRSNYVLTLQLMGPTAPTDKAARYLRGGNVDAAIVVSHHEGDRILTSLGGALPVVFGGRPLGTEERDASYVDVDNVAAAASAVDYLIGTGRTRIATIAGPADMPAGIRRAEGWRNALAAHALEGAGLVHGNFSWAGGAQAMRELLQAHPDLDAVFAASDLMALGAMSVLAERGIRVPDDVAVIGFDDSPAAAQSAIPLTTVRQPSVEMGERMAQMVMSVLAGETVEPRCIMETSIVVRESA